MHGPMGHHMHGGMGYNMNGQMGMHHPGLMVHNNVGYMPGAVMPVGVPVVTGRQMGNRPASMTCPSCNNPIVTKVEAITTYRTHVCALMLLMFWLVWYLLFLFFYFFYSFIDRHLTAISPDK